jgi:succinate dehydrogenase / fumarate reductase flavoprotein subunit
MAVGEAACASVHGANRLGSNSLIDLVVFGRAAGLRCASDLKPHAPARRRRMLRQGAGHVALRPLRHANGGTPTAICAPHAAVMQEDAAVFRTGETLKRGRQAHGRVWGELDIKVTDRSLIWNSDLVETLELDNLMARPSPPWWRRTAPKAAAPTPARTSRPRRRELDEAHAGLGRRRPAR